ncbi:MAG: recombination-associated protein RdgC [Stenotrophomonas sp.]|uniref:recombination-associated protein RdgC n=1 Tax=Stenotrophomonas sp. TaxID=69392 RepID=UPI003D6CA989
MFFKNLTMFRFPAPLDFSALAELLPLCAIKPVGPLEMCSRGFISPFGREEKEVLLHQVGNAIWITTGAEDKILPATVVNEAVAKRLEEIAAREGRIPGGRARKNLRDDVLLELMPRAFVKPSRIDAIVDLTHHLLVVDTASKKSAEAVASDLRGALGSFPAVPLNAEVAPRSILTAWIAGEPLPEGLSLGEAAELRDPVEGGGRVKVTDNELLSDEIEKHLDAGKQVTKLALVLEDRVSFELGDDLVLRKVKFLDGALDQLQNIDEDGRRAELDARFVLQSGEIRRLFTVLEQAFKLSKAEV